MAKKTEETTEEKKGIPPWMKIGGIVGGVVVLEAVTIIVLLLIFMGPQGPKETDPDKEAPDERNLIAITAVDSSFTNYQSGVTSPMGYAVRVDIVIDAGDLTDEAQAAKVEAFKTLVQEREGLFVADTREVITNADPSDLRSGSSTRLKSELTTKFRARMSGSDFEIRDVEIPQINPFKRE